MNLELHYNQKIEINKKDKMKKTITLLALALGLFATKAQTVVADFETLPLATNSAYSSTTGVSFSTAGASFQHKYSGYWSGGFSYTNKYDSATAGFGNMYGVKPLKGYNNSSVYTVAQDKGVINLSAPSNTVDGFYITNTTYAYESMQNGDQFAKKFGGTTGNDPDFFKVTVRGYKGGVLKTDSVDFYLADFRFTNNTLDYLVNTWQWVNTSSLGNVDSLKFFMFTSDNGSFGPNTPLFFAIDNFTTIQSSVGLAKNTNSLKFDNYPNPFNSSIVIRLKSNFEKEATAIIFDINGEILLQQQVTEAQTTLDVNFLQSGIYFLEVVADNYRAVKKISKN